MTWWQGHSQGSLWKSNIRIFYYFQRRAWLLLFLSPLHLFLSCYVMSRFTLDLYINKIPQLINTFQTILQCDSSFPKRESCFFYDFMSVPLSDQCDTGHAVLHSNYNAASCCNRRVRHYFFKLMLLWSKTSLHHMKVGSDWQILNIISKQQILSSHLLWIREHTYLMLQNQTSPKIRGAYPT